LKRAKDIEKINRQYMKPGAAEGGNIDLSAPEAEIRAAVAKLGDSITDRAAYTSALFAVLQANSDFPDRLAPFADAQLVDLKSSGTTATGVLDGTFLGPGKSKTPITFRKGNGGWKIDILGQFGVSPKPSAAPRRIPKVPPSETVPPKARASMPDKPQPKLKAPNVARPPETAQAGRPKKPAMPVLPDVGELKPIDQPDDGGFSKLHRAAMGRNLDQVRQLLDQGADPNVRQRTFFGTPLQYAAANGGLDVVALLVEHGAVVDAADSSGRTPLMWAAWKGQTDVVRALLDAAADIQLSSGSQWTALHFAADKGHLDTARLLIERGASTNAKTIDGKTPLDMNPLIAAPR
jgi:hypothetical protein